MHDAWSVCFVLTMCPQEEGGESCSSCFRHVVNFQKVSYMMTIIPFGPRCLCCSIQRCTAPVRRAF